MKIYLIGDKGERTAFKITTAHVVTDITFMLDDLLEDYGKGLTYRDKFREVESSSSGYNVYIAELDDMKNTAKKLTGKSWKIVLNEYIDRNKESVNAAGIKRRKILKG